MWKFPWVSIFQVNLGQKALSAQPADHRQDLVEARVVPRALAGVYPIVDARCVWGWEVQYEPPFTRLDLLWDDAKWTGVWLDCFWVPDQLSSPLAALPGGNLKLPWDAPLQIPCSSLPPFCGSRTVLRLKPIRKPSLKRRSRKSARRASGKLLAILSTLA